MSLAVVAVVLALVGEATAAGGHVLDDVARLAVTVDVEHPVDGAAPDELTRRLAAFVEQLAPPAVILDPTSADRLRLTVSVRPYSSSALRGFPLPFSGTYAIGVVRLSLERPVQIAGGAPRSTSAILWQRDRIVATRWTVAGDAVTRAATSLLDDLRSVDRNK